MADPVGQPVIDGLVTRAACRADSVGDAMIHRCRSTGSGWSSCRCPAPMTVPAPADGSCRMTIAAREASGLVNRSFSPVSVRHVSVTSVVQRPDCVLLQSTDGTDGGAESGYADRPPGFFL
jgi:hypothetical protein